MNIQGDTAAAAPYRWKAGWAEPDDEQELLQLFRRSFGHEMPPEQWRWKYADSTPAGSLVREQEQVVAFYGGMPRGVLMFGAQGVAVQIGDVMVEPSRRRILTRRGPFFLSASSFAEGLVGRGKIYDCAFGFPSERHNRLGERLGLYGRIGEILDAAWSPLTYRRMMTMRVRPFTESHLHLVAPLWHGMAAGLAGAVVLARDAAYIRHRYLLHPSVQYSPFLVTHRFSGKPLGLLVLRDNGQAGVELLDLLAPLAMMPTLVEIARRITGKLGRLKLYAWLTRQVADLLADSQTDIAATDIHIPTIVWRQQPDILHTRDSWWLMGGDTDFR